MSSVKTTTSLPRIIPPDCYLKKSGRRICKEPNSYRGGIGGFGQAIPVGYHRYWVDWFWSTQFIVIYSSAFDTILSYEFQEDDTADGVLSEIIYNKMVIYPFISEQKDFGYSDVTLGNMEYPGKIREFFKRANARFKMIRTIQDLSVPKY